MWQDTRSTPKNQLPSYTQMIKKQGWEIRETSPFMIATNSIKYLGITMTKEVKDLSDKTLSL